MKHDHDPLAVVAELEATFSTPKRPARPQAHSPAVERRKRFERSVLPLRDVVRAAVAAEHLAAERLALVHQGWREAHDALVVATSQRQARERELADALAALEKIR